MIVTVQTSRIEWHNDTPTTERRMVEKRIRKPINFGRLRIRVSVRRRYFFAIAPATTNRLLRFHVSAAEPKHMLITRITTNPSKWSGFVQFTTSNVTAR